MKKYVCVHIHIQGKCEGYGAIVFFMILDLIPFVSCMRCNVVCKMLIRYLRVEIVRVIIFSLGAKMISFIFLNMTNLGNSVLFIFVQITFKSFSCVSAFLTNSFWSQ